MQYRVNDLCIGCGLCTSICPEVFYMNDTGLASAISEDVPEEQLGGAEDAKNSCPVNAIESGWRD